MQKLTAAPREQHHCLQTHVQKNQNTRLLPRIAQKNAWSTNCNKETYKVAVVVS
jgi:hypothetical protein